ncbi:MAG: LysM peptidoglycan-binding domain-containing M23 family metallopeptidase [Neisseriaceae bacterium]
MRVHRMPSGLFLSLFLVLLAACGTGPQEPPSLRSTTQGHSGGYHRVQAGENLYRLSLKYKTTVATLLRLNHLSSASELRVGQLIKIPIHHNEGQRKYASTFPRGSAALSAMHFIWPVKGQVLQPYDAPAHKGVTILTKAFESVHAVESGKVLYSDYVEGYGNLILISHTADNSVLTVYGNNQNVKVKLNQRVQKGQEISTVGTNDANQPVLYFEIRVHSKAVNPLTYLP